MATAPIFELNQFGTPAVSGLGYFTPINATQCFGWSSAKKWLAFMADHDTPGGIRAATAPALNGPWVPLNGGLNVYATPGTNRHISSPYLIRTATNKVRMYAHLLPGSPDTNQDTFVWTITSPSEGNLTFTWENNQAPIVSHSAVPTDIDSASCSYFACAWDGVQWIGVYAGDPIGDSGAKVVEATTIDPEGLTGWVKTNQAGNNRAWRDDQAESSQNPTPVVINGKMVVVYPALRVDFVNFMRIRDADGTYSRKTIFPVQKGMPTTADTTVKWDRSRMIPYDFAWENGYLYLFYHGGTGDTSGLSPVGDRPGYARIATTVNPLTHSVLMGKAG